MTDHPKIIALEQLIIERRLIKAKVLMQDIAKDLVRLDEVEKELKISKEEINKLNEQLKKVLPSQTLPSPKNG